MSDPISGFIDKLAEFGIRLSNPSALVADGNIHRAHVEGDKHKARNLCYKIHADSTPAAWFQDHKRGITESFSLANGAANNLTPEERALMRSRWEQERLKREAEQAEQYQLRAEYCRSLLASATAAAASHPYVIRKGIAPGPSVKRIEDIPRAEFFNDPEATGTLRDCLLIPLLDADNKVCSVQAILPDGDKFYAAGATTRAAFHPIKGTRPEPILIAEGWATGAALHAATGCSVLCAMNAGNLDVITGFCLTRFPGRRPLVMGDNDHRTDGNPGTTKANSAAEKHGSVALCPTFKPKDDGTDWDDWLRAGGSVDELMASIEQAMNPAVPADEPPPPEPDDPGPAGADVVDIKTKVKRGRPRSTPQGMPPGDATMVDGNTGSVFVSWQSLGLQTSHQGEPHATVSNLRLILSGHPDITGRIWYDEFHDRKFQTLFQSEPTEWADHHDTELLDFIQDRLRLHKMSIHNVRLAIDAHARRNVRNEPREWMQSLTWDGEERLPMMLADGFGVEQDDYSAAVGRCFMVGMVARILDPGCKVDAMPVFEGGQGLGKSTALSIIGGKWFTECHEAVTSKDFYQIMPGKMLIEIAELHAFSKYDIKRVKGIITNRTDRYRVSYGRHAADHPRHSVFGGTTNQNDWNEDDTGARRFWPVACTEINHDYLRANRDQLFAEAVHRFNAGEAWWDVPADRAIELQNDRRSVDEWTETVLMWCAMKPEVKLYDIMVHALSLPVDRHGMSEQRRIGSILYVNGWRKHTLRRSGMMLKIWRNPRKLGVAVDLYE